MGRGQELLDAAREGDKRTVEKLTAQFAKRSGPFTSLRRGAGVNVQDDNGYTPLHHACLRGHKEIVELLLSVDASPCIVDKKGAAPLHLAVFNEKTDIVQMLLNHKNPPVNIDQRTTEHQETALIIAARFGFTTIVEMLIAHGADVALKNVNGETGLDLAAQYGRLGTVELLIRVRPQLLDQYKYPVAKRKIFTSTPLHLASRNGHKSIVMTLLVAGVDPNVRSDDGMPLHEAACFGKSGVVEVLLAKGADLHAVDKRGKTVFDMLNTFPEKAISGIKDVIMRYENSRCAYESEDDLQPFPVPDYSPSYSHSITSYTNTGTSAIMLATNANQININDLDTLSVDKNVTNSYNLNQCKSVIDEFQQKTQALAKRKLSLASVMDNAMNDTENLYENCHCHDEVLETDVKCLKLISTDGNFLDIDQPSPTLTTWNTKINSIENNTSVLNISHNKTSVSDMELNTTDNFYVNYGEPEADINDLDTLSVDKNVTKNVTNLYRNQCKSVIDELQQKSQALAKRKLSLASVIDNTMNDTENLYDICHCHDEVLKTDVSFLKQISTDGNFLDIDQPSPTLSTWNTKINSIENNTSVLNISHNKSSDSDMELNTTDKFYVNYGEPEADSLDEIKKSCLYYENIGFPVNSCESKKDEPVISNKYDALMRDLITKLKKTPEQLPNNNKVTRKTSMASLIETNATLNAGNEKDTVYTYVNTLDIASANLPDDMKAMKALDEPQYLPMSEIKPTHRISVSDSNLKFTDSEYIECDRPLHSYKPRSENFHILGDENCIYNESDYDYIYTINPKTRDCDYPPFIKIKCAADSKPCFCPRNGNLVGKKNRDIFYSCNDVYETCGDKNKRKSLPSCSSNPNDVCDQKTVTHGSSENLEIAENEEFVPAEKKTPHEINIFKKKISHLTQLFTDWKAPETQKHNNTNVNLVTPSSSYITKNHPQSFVKKLASKCLGLKSKFSSAPNISNTKGLESVAEIKDKKSDHKSSTNTLLIGNSKFFKLLSKKEEAGEVVCNDEFDTISLDRLGATLNRDSVVNRSNRSCPGFKTSLPNISENNEQLESSTESIVITEIDCDKNGDTGNNLTQAVNYAAVVIDTNTTREKVNDCYESFGFSNEDIHSSSVDNFRMPKPPPRINVDSKNSQSSIYENVLIENQKVQPKPAIRTHIPPKIPLDEIEKKVVYENITVINDERTPDLLIKTVILNSVQTTDLDEISSPSVSRTSTLSSDSMIDETNLEDILLSEKSKSFKHSKKTRLYPSLPKSDIYRTQSNVSDISDVTDASAIENVDCSDDNNDKSIYLSMTGTLPNKKAENTKKKVLFRHKTFTNIEVDRNSTRVRDLPKWNNDVLKDTLASYHIRGTGHCIYKAPTVQEFIYIFNRETLYRDVEPFTKMPNDQRDSYYETAICFCKARPPKFHNSAEDLLEIASREEEEKVTIDIDSLKNGIELQTSTFRCFCDSEDCKLHDKRRDNNLVVKFSVIKRSISTPDITLNPSPYSTAAKRGILKIKSVPSLEEPYAVVDIEDIILRNKNKCEAPSENLKDGSHSPIYTSMSQQSTISSSSARPYSIKDIAEVISLSDHSTTDTSLECASGLPIRKCSSEHSGHWSLYSCNSNVTVQSEASFKTCMEDSEDDSDGTLHSDDSSDTDTIKSDVSYAKKPWVHSDSFRFGNKEAKSEIGVIVEESLTEVSKVESSGISVEGSESSLSECGDDSGVPRGDVSLASLERGDGARVRSGSGRRRWDEASVSEGDALSVSSAASSCAPLHLAHHHDYNKVSPTPPKKPPRRNLSVSPTHANSPSSGYSYELRAHARSQDDLDDLQGAKHYLKHGRSVDQYVDGKLSYSEYEDNHNSPRIPPIPNPRPSLKNRTQPVAITAMYENVVVKEQNPRRKLRRNVNLENSEPKMERPRKYSNQERSSLESLLDDQSNSPSEYERRRLDMPLSPTHYEQPPTPDHPPPSAKQAENSIHERIRPLSQEYKRRSIVRDSQTEMDVMYLLRATSVASVASGATDRSGNTDNCVEEYVCDVPFAGLFKGSTTTLDGIGLRPMPAERPKTLRKLKSVYDSSPTEPPTINSANLGSNGQAIERSVNGVDEDVRRRSNTTSSTHSGDKSLSILSPFDEQEEWAKISEIMASFGSKLVRESVFVSELEQEFTSRLGLSCSESSLSPSVASNLGLWLSGIGMQDYESLFLDYGYDDIEFINGLLNENDLREMGIEENDRQKILESAKQLPIKITEISNNNNNNISKNQNESVEKWLRDINLEQYNETFRKHLYLDMEKVKRIWEVELTAVLEIQKSAHRKRILASVSGEQNGPANHVEDINADLKTLKTTIKQLKEEIKEKLPPSDNLKPVPPPVVPKLAPSGGETLKRSKKNRPAPQPPRPSDLEIRAPSELLVGVPGALKTQWKHQPFVLVNGAVTYVANYLGSTVVKELRGTESTKKSIQKLKKSTKEPRDSPDIILSISYRGVKFLNTITRDLICEHEIRNIHCACQDADDLTHFAYITKDHTTKSHFCHVFRVATMDQATEVILTLGEAFEVAYQMALREQANRARVTHSMAKTPTHDPMTTTNKEKVNVNHGRSHSITEIKLNGHQLKIAPIPASLSNEDFQSVRSTDGSRSPRTQLLKAPIASTEEL